MKYFLLTIFVIYASILLFLVSFNALVHIGVIVK